MDAERLYAQVQSGERTVKSCSQDEVEALYDCLTARYQSGEPYDEAIYFACAARIREFALELGLADAPNGGLHLVHQLELLQQKMQDDALREQRARKWRVLFGVVVLVIAGVLSVIAVDAGKRFLELMSP